MIHDMPHHPGMFEERQAALADMSLPAFCRTITQTRCDGSECLEGYFKSITENGGEGVMLRAAGSRYEPWRSRSLLKKKIAQ